MNFAMRNIWAFARPERERIVKLIRNNESIAAVSAAISGSDSAYALQFTKLGIDMLDEGDESTPFDVLEASKAHLEDATTKALCVAVPRGNRGEDALHELQHHLQQAELQMLKLNAILRGES